VEEVEETIESEEESEEDSPKHISNRATRVGLPNMAKRTLFKKTELNSYLSTMDEKDRKTWGEGVFKALRAKTARSTENPTVKGTMWSNRNGGRSTDADAIMDSGCTHPLITQTVTDALNMEITPLSRDLEIVEASGKNLTILGTVQIYLECEVLGGRKLMEAAVIAGEGASEVLVSLGLLKKWDMIHDSFPEETVSDCIQRVTKKTN